jgi:hypothetical protein
MSVVLMSVVLMSVVLMAAVATVAAMEGRLPEVALAADGETRQQFLSGRLPAGRALRLSGLLKGADCLELLLAGFAKVLVERHHF